MSIPKRNIRTIYLLFFGVFLIACAWVRGNVTPTATLAPNTTTSTNPPAYTKTLPAPTRIPNLFELTPTRLVPVPTQWGQQTYLDPSGWFSVNLPLAWKAISPQAFSGEDGFFETGYMPEMMYRHYPMSVCHWLANVQTKSIYYITAGGPSHKVRSCALATLPGVTPASVQLIIQNPEVSAEQRFFYIKTDAEHFNSIIDTFAWLRPVDRYREPAVQQLPLRPEDAAFWKNTAPLSSKFLIQEYVLPSEAQRSGAFQDALGNFIPADAPRLDWQKEHDFSVASDDNVHQRLKELGYELTLNSTGQTNPRLSTLYKDGSVFINDVYSIRRIYTFNSTSGKPIVAFMVIGGKECFLIQNDMLIEAGTTCFNDPYRDPILYRDELLWVRAAENMYLQVQTSQQEVLFSFATYFGSTWPVNRFRSWRDHWILESDGFSDGLLVVDGEIINEKFGFEEAYGWYVVKDRPFYFFRKGPQMGISYNGKFLSTDYDEIGHGKYNEPIGDGSRVSFYGRRDGLWYYVVVKPY